MGFKTAWREWVLGGVALLFFCSSLITTVGISSMYNSPDERANATFTSTFANESQLVVDHVINERVPIAAPRSTVIADGQIVPASFIGLPVVYGWMSRAVGMSLTHVLTPLLAVLAVFAWYQLIGKTYGKNAGLFAAMLMVGLAAFWFYSGRVMMHNVPFVSLGILGIYTLVNRPLGKFACANMAAAGLLFGGALLFRTSEWLLLGVIGAVFLAWFPKKLRVRDVVTLLVTAAVPLIAYLVHNQAIFGSAWISGYTFRPVTPDWFVPQLSESATEDALPGWLQMIFPFGIHPRAAARNFVFYQIYLVWWSAAVAFLTIPWLWLKRTVAERRISWAILTTWVLTGVYLTILYGSWHIVDNPDPNAITLANSYMRYWLPLFIIGTIPGALFLDWISKRPWKGLQHGVIAGVLIGVLGLSAQLVFFHPEDGLVRTRVVLQESEQIRAAVYERVPENAVMIVDRSDKIFFPDRQVVYPLRSELTYAALPRLVEAAPLFYYGITLPEEDIQHLVETRLSPAGLQIEHVETFGIESLYIITRL